MLILKPVELKDKVWMEPLLAHSNFRVCHQNFTNIYIWSEYYHYRVGQVQDRLIVKGYIDGEPPYFFFPAGSGSVAEVVGIMKEDADRNGHPFIILGLSPENMEELNRIYPEGFEVQALRDSFDYIYQIEKLVTLSGNKLHSKRNHINRFKENHEWSFELITSENIAECVEMSALWCKENNCRDDVNLLHENCAVRIAFQNFSELGLEGGLLRSGEKVIAYTMGERQNSDTYVIHIEKAFGSIQGAYQMINNQFATYVSKTHPQLIYMNREEDMGEEGLRKAKLSYKPIIMEEKYSASWV